jgi:hypothetical protein
MRADGLTIEVTATIPDKTVERCLRLIEMWLADNPDKRISGGLRDADGKVMPFKIERRVSEPPKEG